MKYAYDAVASQLKQALKKRRISYAELAARMGLSESGVKKIMTNDDVSLARLSEICEAAEIDMLDLLEVAWKAPPVPFYLNDEQRSFFEDHPDCYVFHMELLNAHLDPDKVRRDYGLDQRSVTLYLAGLESIGLITPLPSGRLRSAIPAPHRVGGGPKAIGEGMVRQFIEHSFGLDIERRRQAKAQLRMTTEHWAEFKSALHDVVLRYGMMAQQDELTTRPEDLVDVGVLTVLAQCATKDYMPIPRIKRKLRKRS